MFNHGDADHPEPVTPRTSSLLGLPPGGLTRVLALEEGKKDHADQDRPHSNSESSVLSVDEPDLSTSPGQPPPLPSSNPAWSPPIPPRSAATHAPGGLGISVELADSDAHEHNLAEGSEMSVSISSELSNDDWNDVRSRFPSFSTRLPPPPEQDDAEDEEGDPIQEERVWDAFEGRVRRLSALSIGGIGCGLSTHVEGVEESADSSP